jgi:aldose 1-epimerase
VLPTHHRDVPSELDPRSGLAMNDVVIDNVFTGFEGRVAIIWPEWRTRLTMTASDPLRFLVLYVPDAATSSEEAATGIAPYFCAEPVSNITNAFNLIQNGGHIETGMIALAPGDEARATVRFQPEIV